MMHYDLHSLLASNDADPSTPSAVEQGLYVSFLSRGFLHQSDVPGWVSHPFYQSGK